MTNYEVCLTCRLKFIHEITMILSDLLLQRNERIATINEERNNRVHCFVNAIL